MTVEGRRPTLFGFGKHIREIPVGEGVMLDDRPPMVMRGFLIKDPDTIVLGNFGVLNDGRTVKATAVLRKEEINTADLRNKSPLSLRDRLLGRGRERYIWKP